MVRQLVQYIEIVIVSELLNPHTSGSLLSNPNSLITEIDIANETHQRQLASELL